VKYWKLANDGSDLLVAVLDFGREEKQNFLRRQTFEELDEILTHTLPYRKAMVILSAKTESFCAGADIDEIRDILKNPDSVGELLKRAHEILLKIKGSPRPIVAAVSGTCLGGGLELALACHGRVAARHPKTVFGLPETSIGIIPGFGGTQLLPRLVGLKKSLEIILAQRKLTADDALKAGLVNAVAAPDELLSKAVQLARDMVSGKSRTKSRRPLLESIPGARRLLLWKAADRVFSQTKGAYPAPFHAIEAVRASSRPLEAGLEKEAQCFVNCVKSPEAKALLDIFFLRKEARSRRWVEWDIPTPVNKVGVVGAGFMGRRIAYAALSAGLPVRLHDTFPQAVHGATIFVEEQIKKELAKGKLAPKRAAEMRHLLTGSWGEKLGPLLDCDFIVEAVKEELEEKKRVFNALETLLPAHTVMVTNTSSLPPSQIAAALQYKDRFAAMHFFSTPSGLMDLVEIVGVPETNSRTIAKTLTLAKLLGKTPVVLQKECAGLVVNRVLVRGMAWALDFIRRFEADPWYIDWLLERHGMAMGPFKTADLVGFDTGSHVIGIMQSHYPDPHRYPPKIGDFNLAARKDLLGEKTGQGFYVWENGKPVKPNRAAPALLGLVKEDVPLDRLASEAAYKALIDHMKAEARSLVAEGISSSEMIDLALVLGAGICPNRRGLLGGL